MEDVTRKDVDELLKLRSDQNDTFVTTKEIINLYPELFGMFDFVIVSDVKNYMAIAKFSTINFTGMYDLDIYVKND